MRPTTSIRRITTTTGVLASGCSSPGRRPTSILAFPSPRISLIRKAASLTSLLAAVSNLQHPSEPFHEPYAQNLDHHHCLCRGRGRASGPAGAEDRHRGHGEDL